MKVMTVVGTRPEIIKLSQVIKQLDEYTNHIIVHTGQNYDYELNELFFEQLDIRKPDIFLEAVKGTPSETIGDIISKIDKVFSERDKQRYKSHQKLEYPSEDNYAPKQKVTKYVKKIYSAPTVINLEMTEACNVKCRHCYNPWREEHAGKFNLAEVAAPPSPL